MDLKNLVRSQTKHVPWILVWLIHNYDECNFLFKNKKFMNGKKEKYVLRNRTIDYWKGINLSYYPWIKKIEDLTFLIKFALSNLSLNIFAVKQPAKSFTTPLIDVKADMRTKTAGFLLAAK